VVVRYPAEERRSLAALDDVMIRTQGGAEVPLHTVAAIERAWADSSIQRGDQKRTIRVKANVDKEGANSTEIVRSLQAHVLPDILADHPGVTYTLEGHQAEQGDFVESFARGYILGLIAIFSLMAVTLRSYTEPLIVLLAVPFAIVGACLGHALFQIDLTMYTLIGVLGVSGVVVNDSLVLLHAIGAQRATGVSLEEAVEKGCTQRFRAVILTTLTTFLGLVPLMLDSNTHAQELKPMAIALAFGELMSTVIVLLVVPVAWVVVERLRESSAATSQVDRAQPSPSHRPLIASPPTGPG
jgi:multidrug efflux pump subunit AcrB